MTTRKRDLVGTGHPTTRLEALTDGVFAIVMTLLVFDLRLPAERVDLSVALRDVAPSFAAYLFSFLQLGVYWVGHRNQCAFIEREDHKLRWIALAFLAAVALVPFTTQVLGRYPFVQLAEFIYVTNLVLVGALLTWHWRHATHRRRLVADDLPDAVIRAGFERTVFAPIVYVLAFLVSLATSRTVLLFAVLAPLPYLFPHVMDAFWGAVERISGRRKR